MSIFRTITVACPACGEGVQFDAVYSVNADRRPDLRDAILNHSFQRGTCGKCQKTFRLDPELVYLDVGRSQWIAAFPLDRLREWESAEQEAMAAFDRAFGDQAGPAASDVGAGLKRRVVFGWAALREKIFAAENGIDDVTLELTKIALFRSQPSSPLSDESELRLIAVPEEAEELVLAWLNSREESVIEALGVPRSIYDENAADEEGWKELRGELSAGPFVDMQRLMIVSQPPA